LLEKGKLSLDSRSKQLEMLKLKPRCYPGESQTGLPYIPSKN